MLRIVAGVIALLTLTACDRDAALRRDVQRAVENTVPQSTQPYPPALNRSESGVEATWEFTTDWAWGRYAEWVGDRLSADFERRPSSDGTLFFVRVLTGDTYTIRLDVLQPGPPTRIRATFTARAS